MQDQHLQKVLAGLDYKDTSNVSMDPSMELPDFSQEMNELKQDIDKLNHQVYSAVPQAVESQQDREKPQSLKLSQDFKTGALLEKVFEQKFKPSKPSPVKEVSDEESFKIPKNEAIQEFLGTLDAKHLMELKNTERLIQELKRERQLLEDSPSRKVRPPSALHGEPSHTSNFRAPPTAALEAELGYAGADRLHLHPLHLDLKSSLASAHTEELTNNYRSEIALLRADPLISDHRQETFGAQNHLMTERQTAALEKAQSSADRLSMNFSPVHPKRESESRYDAAYRSTYEKLMWPNEAQKEEQPMINYKQLAQRHEPHDKMSHPIRSVFLRNLYDNKSGDVPDASKAPGQALQPLVDDLRQSYEPPVTKEEFRNMSRKERTDLLERELLRSKLAMPPPSAPSHHRHAPSNPLPSQPLLSHPMTAMESQLEEDQHRQRGFNSQAAAHAIKALKEKNFQLESNLGVMENLLKQYKSETGALTETLSMQKSEPLLKFKHSQEVAELNGRIQLQASEIERINKDWIKDREHYAKTNSKLESENRDLKKKIRELEDKVESYRERGVKQDRQLENEQFKATQLQCELDTLKNSNVIDQEKNKLIEQLRYELNEKGKLIKEILKKHALEIQFLSTEKQFMKKHNQIPDSTLSRDHIDIIDQLSPKRKQSLEELKANIMEGEAFRKTFPMSYDDSSFNQASAKVDQDTDFPALGSKKNSQQPEKKPTLVTIQPLGGASHDEMVIDRHGQTSPSSSSEAAFSPYDRKETYNTQNQWNEGASDPGYKNSSVGHQGAMVGSRANSFMEQKKLEGLHQELVPKLDTQRTSSNSLERAIPVASSSSTSQMVTDPSMKRIPTQQLTAITEEPIQMTKQKVTPFLNRDTSSVNKIQSSENPRDSPSQLLRSKKNPTDMFKPPKPFNRPGSSIDKNEPIIPALASTFSDKPQKELIPNIGPSPRGLEITEQLKRVQSNSSNLSAGQPPKTSMTQSKTVAPPKILKTKSRLPPSSATSKIGRNSNIKAAQSKNLSSSKGFSPLNSVHRLDKAIGKLNHGLQVLSASKPTSSRPQSAFKHRNSFSSKQSAIPAQPKQTLLKSSSSVPALKKQSSRSVLKTMGTKNLPPTTPKLKSVEVVKKKITGTDKATKTRSTPQKKLVHSQPPSVGSSKRLASGTTLMKSGKKKKKSKFKKNITKNSLDDEVSDIDSDGFQMGQTEGLPDQFTPEKTAGGLESSRQSPSVQQPPLHRSHLDSRSNNSHERESLRQSKIGSRLEESRPESRANSKMDVKPEVQVYKSNSQQSRPKSKADSKKSFKQSQDDRDSQELRLNKMSLDRIYIRETPPRSNSRKNSSTSMRSKGPINSGRSQKKLNSRKNSPSLAKAKKTSMRISLKANSIHSQSNRSEIYPEEEKEGRVLSINIQKSSGEADVVENQSAHQSSEGEKQ